MSRTVPCAAHCVRKDTSAKRPERLRQWRTRPAARHNYHTLPAAWPTAHQNAESRLSLPNAVPCGAREHGSEYTDEWHRAKELAKLQLAAKLMQPLHARRCSKFLSSRGENRSQLQLRARGGFRLGGLLAWTDSKGRDGRQPCCALDDIHLSRVGRWNHRCRLSRS